MKKLEKLTQITPVSNPLMKQREYLHQKAEVGQIVPRKGILLDENREEALKKMDKIRALTSLLPGFDCGACGAPTCRKLAEDIVRQTARMSHCVFVQQEMELNRKLTPEEAKEVIEHIWGKDRMNKWNKDDEE